MSEKMTPIPFRALMSWIEAENKSTGGVFSVAHPYRAKDKYIPIFGEKIETPIGPAAGPNTQLAQNIIASYFAGARFFELKTVQVIDGEELASFVSRPCILANNEGYNCEWSTELTVQQAFEEYVKAWCALKVLCRHWGIGYPDGFVFNMSVGYDLAGIKSEKVDSFIDGLKNAKNTSIFRECLSVLTDLYPDEADYIANISPQICSSATLSTLHGCPPDEIERISAYLLTEKGLHTFIKCNPTILGYESARKLLDDIGYYYIAFDDHHFREDLQYEDAVPMFHRLLTLAAQNRLEFGLKLSNTFPVDVKQNELPSAEMYMSGRSLFPLTVEMARRISRDFDGKMRISFAGGADYFNIKKLYCAGIFPITVATTILKLGGYQRLKQIAENLEGLTFHAFENVDTAALDKIAAGILTDKHHLNALKPLPNRKIRAKVPLMDCFDDPCRDGCPIKQDIPEYIELYRIGHYADALRVILARNPLPFITGTICTHRCMDKCTRNYYESPLQIRSIKLLCAEGGYDDVIGEVRPLSNRPEIRVAIVGGGTTGMAAAHFLARYGARVTIFDRNETLGGVVRHVIPGFRISNETIEKDASFLRKLGVEIRLGADAPSVKELKSMGYTNIFLATGAWKSGKLDVDGNVKPVIPWLKALKAGDDTKLGKHVIVVGGGNTAMDAARTAKQVAGVESVSLLYRRSKKYMPADEHELYEAIDDGVGFIELASPVKQEDGILTCRKMALGEPDEKGRRAPLETAELFEVPCDTLISAVGEQVDGEFFTSQGISVDGRNRPVFECGDGIFCGGDCMRGAATIIEGVADAKLFAETVLGIKISAEIPPEANRSTDEAVAKKGNLVEGGFEGDRCLSCQVVCQRCVDVCPNRANVTVKLPDGRVQILHIDRMCNECGNCGTFCVYESLPYKEKFTLFHTVEEFEESSNFGFVLLGMGKVRVRMIGVKDHDLYGQNTLPPDLKVFIKTVVEEYGYMI